MKGYTFKLGGADWDVDIAGDMGARWNLSVATNSITLAAIMTGKPLREDVMKKHLWNAVYDAIHNKVMYRKGKIWDRYFFAVMNGVANIMNNLPLIMPTSDSPRFVEIIGQAYEIRVENLICQQDKIYGRCNPNNFNIIIQDEEKGIKYHPQFVRQTMIHECLHALNYELGLQGTKWDEEDQVNTLSYILSEVWHTLNPKTTDNATDTEDAKT